VRWRLIEAGDFQEAVEVALDPKRGEFVRHYADGPPGRVLSDSLVFSTQVNKLLGNGWLLVDELPIGPA